MDTSQENKMIAEFIGMTLQSKEDHGHSDFDWTGCPKNKHWPFESAPPFDTSWDWLMPVVEKISRIPLPYKEDDDRQDTHWPRTFGMLDEWDKPMFRFNCSTLFVADTLIEAAYLAVVDFIEWYNKNKPQ